jgi:hypothetical protein
MDGPGMQPRYYNPKYETPPPEARTGEIGFPRIADPDNPRKFLVIKSSKRIKDHAVVRYLAKKYYGAQLKPKSGTLMYDPEEVITQGYLTRDELDGLAKGIDPDDGKKPPEPYKNFGLMTAEKLDRYALDRAIPGYPFNGTRLAREACVKKWQESKD